MTLLLLLHNCPCIAHAFFVSLQRRRRPLFIDCSSYQINVKASIQTIIGTERVSILLFLSFREIFGHSVYGNISPDVIKYPHCCCRWISVTPSLVFSDKRSFSSNQASDHPAWPSRIHSLSLEDKKLSKPAIPLQVLVVVTCGKLSFLSLVFPDVCPQQDRTWQLLSVGVHHHRFYLCPWRRSVSVLLKYLSLTAGRALTQCALSSWMT